MKLTTLNAVFALFLLSFLIYDAALFAQTELTYAWTNFVGQPGGPGNADGTGYAARFYYPQGIALDKSGNAYVTDNANHTIRKVTSAGVVTTVAGKPGLPGNFDGVGSAAQFNTPIGIAIDDAGNIFVADSGNNTIRKVTNDGVVTTLVGMPGQSGSADGTGSAARFNGPSGLALDDAGNLYVADRDNFVIRKVSNSGVVTTFTGTAGSSNSVDGVGTQARFYQIFGIARDKEGNLYAVDSLDPLNLPNSVNATIRKITSDGVVTTLAGSTNSAGSTDGLGSEARFNAPRGIAVDALGNVYVGDYGNHTIRKITGAGLVTTVAGSAGVAGVDDGAGSAARFNRPYGIAVDGSGNLYVTDRLNDTIRTITNDGVVKTLAGSPPHGGFTDGSGNVARFNSPLDVKLSAEGNLYVADTDNELIRKVSQNGEVTTLAGKRGVIGPIDGVGNKATFNKPSQVAVDASGNVYVADSFSHSIRKITPDGVVATFAGSWSRIGSTDGSSSDATFTNPSGIAADSVGNLFVSDINNYTIRKISTDGLVTTLAGTPNRIGGVDGAGPAARFRSPQGLAVDTSGSIYVADTLNNSIRKVTSDGVVSSLAGRPAPDSAGFADAAGTNAHFKRPTGVAVDATGNVYVADTLNNLIRKITKDGVVTTVGGQAGIAGSADGIGSAAQFSSPSGIAVDSQGNLYVADSLNNRVAKGTPLLQTPVLPALTLRRSSDTIVISWSSAATGFDLQQSANLASSSNWAPSSYIVMDDGTNRSIKISLVSNSVFFRLRGN
ncbi:MAG: hypothetical protein HY043_13850 [Verrucomicrobia bacterium]|nr:hypothetical protein [Verrucomicrobiota bacterium]